jgi:hypothetical protein
MANARGLSELYRTVLNHTAACRQTIRGLPRGRGTADTTGPSANPMPFPHIPSGDIILWCSVCELYQRPTTGGVAKIQFSTPILYLEDCR